MNVRQSRSPLVHDSLGVADGAMLLVITIWAVNSVLTKAALGDHINPRVYVFLRFAIVAAILVPLLAVQGRNLRVRREDYGRFLLTGITGYALYNMLFVIGLSKTSAFSAAILVGLAPIFTLLIAMLLGLEQVRRWQWAGVGVAAAGVAIFLGDKIAVGEPALGDLLNISAAISFAVYSLATRDLVLRYGAPVATAWSVVIGLVAVLPFTLPAVASEDWRNLGLVGWSSVAYASVMSMLVAHTLWSWAISRTGPGRTAPYLFLLPLVTGALAIVFLDDRLAPAQVVGGAIALIGVTLARLGAGSRPAPTPIAVEPPVRGPGKREAVPGP
jgi:drug/metabolite transporter (DMT)-like permease